MKREDLKALGLTDENIDAVMKLHGSDLEGHKATITTLTGERDTFKTQADEATKQIKAFEGLDIEGVKKAAADWETKAKQLETESASKIQALKFDYALQKELKEVYKVKDPKDVIPHLKADAIKFDEDKFIGLKEQIEPLKSAKDYLFESDKQTPRIVAGGNSQTVITDPIIAAARQAAGLKEPTT